MPHDLPTRTDLGFWLGRHPGVAGMALTRVAMDHACRHAPAPCLYTLPYRHLGRNAFAQDEHKGRRVTLMQYHCMRDCICRDAGKS